MNVSAFAKASAQCHRVLRMHSCAADFLRRTSEQLILRILRRIRLAGKQKAVAEPDFAFAAADDPSSGFDGKKLPIGCQLIGSKFSEQTLFDTANCYEQLVGGFDLSATLQ